MSHELSDKCLFVGLTSYETLGKELQTVNVTARENPNRDVVMDFSKVHMLTSSNLSNLMILHKLLEENDRRLILCNVSFQIKCEFTVCGLRELFHFAEDKFEAMTALEQAGPAPNPA
jgi:anti-anti-sigma regulatory factor